MKRLFEEYSVLLLCFICSMVGFNLLYNVITNGHYIHGIINHLLYGVLWEH